MLVHRFKSTANFDVRRRAVTTPIERATFVVFSLGALRCAAPVEVVDRVLRVDTQNPPTPTATIDFRGQQVPLADFREALHLPVATTVSSHSRVLVVSMLGELRAIVADAVHEVATIDASLIRPLPTDTSGWWFAGDRATWPSGTRGVFERLGHDVVILDMLRLTRK